MAPYSLSPPIHPLLTPSHWCMQKLSMRQEVLKRLLGIAKSLRDQNNFAALMGVLTGLNMAAAQRLKCTFDTHGKLASVPLRSTPSTRSMDVALRERGVVGVGSVWMAAVESVWLF